MSKLILKLKSYTPLCCMSNMYFTYKLHYTNIKYTPSYLNSKLLKNFQIFNVWKKKNGKQTLKQFIIVYFKQIVVGSIWWHSCKAKILPSIQHIVVIVRSYNILYKENFYILTKHVSRVSQNTFTLKYSKFHSSIHFLLPETNDTKVLIEFLC